MTPKQQQLLAYVRDYFERTGLTPTVQEMRDALDLKSKSGVFRLVDALVEQGHLLRTPNRARGLDLPMASLAAVPTALLEMELARRTLEEKRRSQ